MQLVAEIVPRLGPDVRSLFERLAHLLRLHERDKALGERRAHGLDDDKSLRGDAALAGIDQSRVDARLRRLVEIRVLEHDVGIRTAQFEHRLF